MRPTNPTTPTPSPTRTPRGNRPMFAFPRHPATRHRGVTLVEMLVVVALVVLMMTILVQIFAATTGSMTVSRTIQELDLSLRLLDQTIRQDLQGATARFTPPLDPTQNLGYFEYGENAFADYQGEDTDDFLALTTRAPEGQVFNGRQWLFQTVTDPADPKKQYQTINQSVQPTTITSRVAEVIYFLRNGNLYRRTFLVVPERAKSIVAGQLNGGRNFTTGIFGSATNVSWQGMNDISARSGGFSPGTTPVSLLTPVPNSLGDLTNRENRAFRPRFANDFHTSTSDTGIIPDGVPDDFNGDGVPDYYPTLYYDGGANNNLGSGWAPNGRVREGQPYNNGIERNQTTGALWDIYAFPYIYPGMYSVPADYNSNRGWIHQLFPATDATTKNAVPNHAPLENGDLYAPTGNQTWFGFPTWRETMTGKKDNTNTGWTDPIDSPNKLGSFQALALRPFDPRSLPDPADLRFMPPVTNNGTQISPFKSDNAGSASFSPSNTTPGFIWEDDLVMTNVRSFDIKAYDPDATLYGIGNGYYDLGYAGLVDGLNVTNYGSNSLAFQQYAQEPQGFGHEGRMPPKTTDFRANSLRADRYRAALNTAASNNVALNNSSFNVGDDSVGIIRLRRTFDTWSTAYTRAPESDLFLHGSGLNEEPIYPSFPAPYPSPLRGIQIQIRVVDPRNERVKVLTIRQDFTDKL